MRFFEGFGNGFGKKRKTEGFFVNSYGNNQTRGLHTFQIDVENGELIYRKHFNTPSDPTYSFKYGRFVCVSYKNKTGSSADGGICSYAATSEILALASRTSDKGKTYMHGCSDEDNEDTKKMFAVDYYNGEVAVIMLLKKKLNRVLFTYKLEGHSIHPTRQAIPHPHYVGFTPDKERIYVVDLGLDKILFFEVKTDGELILDEEHTFSVKPGSGPKKMLFSNDGKFAYVLNELKNNIMVYKHENLNFELIQTIDSYDKEEEIDNLAGQMIFNSTGEFMFVSNRGHDSITLFKVDLKTGMLTYRDFADTAPSPRDISIFKDRWLVVACQKGNVLETVEFSKQKGGLLFETDFSYMVNEPVCITQF